MLEELTRGFGLCELSLIRICFSFFRAPRVGLRCKIPFEVPPAPLLCPSSLALGLMLLRTEKVLDLVRSIGGGCDAVPWGGSDPPGC